MTRAAKTSSVTVHVAETAARAAELGLVIDVDGFQLDPLDAARWALVQTLVDRGHPRSVQSWNPVPVRIPKEKLQ